MYLNSDYIRHWQRNRRAFKGVMVYIHEATHLYARTDDHNQAGYLIDGLVMDANQYPYREAGLTSAQALNNADSYAGFVYEAASQP
jgi:hypothetical protein